MSDSTSAFTHALSVDIGGTFTDFSLLNLSTGEVSVHKVLTDPERPDQALMRGALELLDGAGVTFGQVQVLVHSTTLVTNGIIERRGSKTALLTTKGFRDILEMGREQIYDMYDLKAQYPEPLVPRYLRREVSERTSRDGDVFAAPDEAEVSSLVAELVEAGVESVAVSFLHSYKNPDNERKVKTLIASRFPDLALSLSSDVAPVINEYERTSTTVADCYIKPGVARYLRSIREELAGAGFAGQFLVMQSAGGVVDAQTAGQHPVRMLESSPAAGALAAGFYGALLGQPDLISLDMGGTTAKTCVIEGGVPAVAGDIEVARVHRFTKGSGLPIVIPVLDLIEIGSGGGSIAWVDELGLLKVGPQSAGAQPGPACYGQGGTEPTVTDADLVLGYLSPDYFLGGRMQLDAGAARRAIAGLGGSLGMDETAAAAGIYGIVTENMAAAARIHIIGRNKDPRNYSVIAFGGAGPLHACGVARILGVTQVIVPLAAGVTSAIGALTAPLSFEVVRSLPARLSDTDWRAVNGVYEEMERRGVEFLRAAGVGKQDVELVRTADMRLSGQIHEINVPIRQGEMGAESAVAIESDFHQTYHELYSRRNLNIPVEVQNWRLLARGPRPNVRLREEAPVEDADARQAIKATRKVYFDAGYVDCPVYDRYLLESGSEIGGPAIVEERESTVLLAPQDCAVVDRWLNLVIDVGPLARR